MKPESTAIFSFPMKTPEGARLREDLSAIEHLDLWLTFQRHWCEHKPSVTISVNENEWPKVGAWTWENFDEITGVSYLPMDGGTYRQAPYESIDEATYAAMVMAMPDSIDWETMTENTDNVEGAQMLSCTAGACEIAF
jgi:ribonucleoside-diphosphate reductase alpha chain